MTLTADKLRTLIDTAREALREQGWLAPTLVVETTDGGVDMIDMQSWTDKTKRAQMYALGRHYGQRAEALYFVADAWVKDMAADEAMERLRQGEKISPVKDLPGRGEGLMGIAEDREGNTVGIEQRYDRTTAGIVFGAVREPEQADSQHVPFVLEPFWRGAGLR